MTGILTWDRREADLPWVRWSTCALRSGEAVAEHRHDFIEVFWVVAGTIGHCRLGGRREALLSGACRVFAPGDGHSLDGIAGGGTLITTSLPGGLFAELQARYSCSPGWPWDADGTPCDRHFDPGVVAALHGVLAALSRRGQDRADAEWYVASLIRALRPAECAVPVPQWLDRAVRAIPTPEGLAEGLPGLVRRSGRNAATVSRAVRCHYGCTPSMLVQRARIEHAGQALRLDGMPILDLAIACGFKDLGHFYRAFKARYGVSPGAWREGAGST